MNQLKSHAKKDDSKIKIIISNKTQLFRASQQSLMERGINWGLADDEVVKLRIFIFS